MDNDVRLGQLERDIAYLRRRVEELDGLIGRDRGLYAARTIGGVRATTLESSVLPDLSALTNLGARTADTTYPGTGNVTKTMVQEAHDDVRQLLATLKSWSGT